MKRAAQAPGVTSPSWLTAITLAQSSTTLQIFGFVLLFFFSQWIAIIHSFCMHLLLNGSVYEFYET